ncbi:energy transducer TonB [Sphingomicrobium sp. XHP0235]|uniref:energy transducer TonB n=1 Tax=Sphingomicrobium aquimarinum TaxID=3133971 RepID=UPI0031FE9CFE
MTLLAVLATLAIAQETPPQPTDPGLAALPRGNLSGIFTVNDYPAEALSNDWEGVVHARLTVDPEGSVSGCEIIESSGHALLDDTTCAILQERARFEPARNSLGEKVSATFAAPPIEWRKKRESRSIILPALSFALSETLDVDACALWFRGDGETVVRPCSSGHLGFAEQVADGFFDDQAFAEGVWTARAMWGEIPFFEMFDASSMPDAQIVREQRYDLVMEAAEVTSCALSYHYPASNDLSVCSSDIRPIPCRIPQRAQAAFCDGPIVYRMVLARDHSDLAGSVIERARDGRFDGLPKYVE